MKGVLYSVYSSYHQTGRLVGWQTMQEQGARGKPEETQISISTSGNWLLGVGLLLLSIFFCAPRSYALMVRWPWVLLWQIALLIIASWTLFRLRLFQVPFRLLGHPFDWAMGLTGLSLLLSTLFAFRPMSSLWYFIMAAGYGVALYAVVNFFGSGETNFPTPPTLSSPHHPFLSTIRQRRWICLQGIGVITFLTILVSLGFWWMYRGQLPEPVNPYPLGQHNFVAGYLVLTLPTLFALAWGERGWRRWMWVLISAIGLFNLSTTGSRGGLLGLLTLLIASGFVLILRVRHVKQGWRWLLMGGLAIGVSLIPLLISPRTQRLWNALAAGELDGTSLFRVYTIQAGWNLWKDYPVLGVGLGNTIKLYDIYRPIEAGTMAFRVQQLHCTPVHLLAELGLLGMLAYGWWLIGTVHLGWKLVRSPLPPDDRPVLYAAGVGLLAYTATSLTDFQLENIGISLTLVLLLALLISLGQDLQPPPQLEVARSRRFLSLAGFTLLVAVLRIWVPVDGGMMLAWSGGQALKAGEVSTFYEEWALANRIVPWEPYYPFQIGAQLAQTIDAFQASPLLGEALPSDPKPNPVAQASSVRILRSAQSELKEALALSPFDELLNRFLGALLVDADPSQSILYLRRAVQLTPRKPYSYALLGVAYWKQNNPAMAVNSFALEGFIHPEFLTTDVWLQPTLRPLWVQTIRKTLPLYDRALTRLSPTDPAYNQLYQDRVLLDWWSRRATTDDPARPSEPSWFASIDHSRLNPIAQAVLLLDQQKPQLALARLQAVAPEEKAAATLLKAWIDPKQHLSGLQSAPNDLSSIMVTVVKTIREIRSIYDWLLSIHTSTKAITEQVGFFAYRNTNGPDRIELPRSLPVNVLVQSLKLFYQMGTEPTFDQTLVESQKQLLNLDRPHIRNGEWG
ncbi:MAG: O-antigen ligase family protein [Leptolyngbyaceae cyanobacterium bins.59]|nr:O-antigen ligase family protein [Leptolyngbyaceae cyanobacterium bins.59]